MSSLVEKILKAENILLNDECVICYKKFINIKDKDYNEFYNKIKDKYKLPKQHIFEDETTCMCYDAKFECSICKNKVCCGCIMNMSDTENGKKLDGFAMFCDDYKKEIYTYDDMATTGIITCPICRVKRL
jgi:hypothetical protein